MKQDKETRSRLLESARAEFMEKGYMNASLRNICKNAGVTTGALYFFFKDKADLFESLTKDTVDAIYHIMQEHYSIEVNMSKLEPIEGTRETEDLDAALSIIHQMYLKREDILLVLTKSQGSSMEHIVDNFIETSEAHYRVMALQMQQMYPGKVIDDKLIHWLAHAQIDAFIYMITHIEDEAEAVKFMSQMVTYLMSGWFGLFGSNT